MVQALFSACAKMCVRELRKTETANVSVFYLSFCSTIGAICAIIIQTFLGVENAIRFPHDWEWLLLVGVGELFLHCLAKNGSSALTARRVKCGELPLVRDWQQKVSRPGVNTRAGVDYASKTG